MKSCLKILKKMILPIACIFLLNLASSVEAASLNDRLKKVRATHPLSAVKQSSKNTSQASAGKRTLKSVTPVVSAKPQAPAGKRTLKNVQKVAGTVTTPKATTKPLSSKQPTLLQKQQLQGANKPKPQAAKPAVHKIR